MMKQHDTDLFLSYLAQDRLDLAETAKHVAQEMNEPRQFNIIPLKRVARHLVGKPKAALRFRKQKHVDKITVFVDSDFAGDPVSRKSTTGSVAQIGNHIVKSGSTLQSLTALSVGEREFHAVVKKGQVGLSLRSTYQNLGIPMSIEIQSDSSTANSMTDLGARQRTKHIDTRYNCADVGTKPVSTMDPTFHHKMKGAADRESKAQKQTIVNISRELRDGCINEVIPMSGGQV